MESFDLMVIGSGAGLHVASQAAGAGWRVALIERGPAGGTCLNNGCIPSKMLLYPADLIRTLQDAKKVGVTASIEAIDFQRIMSRMHEVVDESRRHLERSVQAKRNLTWFADTGEFVADYVLKVGKNLITAPKIVIASGARPLVPLIPGLQEAGYLDNNTLLDLHEAPESLIIIGAGYIGCEYGHFFSAMGCKVTILGRSPEVLSGEDPEVRRIVAEALSQHLRLITGHEAVKIEPSGGKKVVSARNRADGEILPLEADEILLAAGRRSNADLLAPEKTGVQIDPQGWIKVNDYLETSKPGIWALGDATGKHMFRHTANYESALIAHNLLRARKKDEREKADFHAVPYAIFTCPQVAGVGMKEAEALAAGLKVLVGKASYMDVAKGRAMAEEHGLAKVLLEEASGRILGATVVGPMASELVQQVTYLMNTEHQDLRTMVRSQVIHPTINEVLVEAFSELERPVPSEER